MKTVTEVQRDEIEKLSGGGGRGERLSKIGRGSLSKIGGGGEEGEREMGGRDRERNRQVGRQTGGEGGGGGPNVSVINVGETRVRVVSLQ